MCARNVLFPREQTRILGRTSRLQECSALVESLVCKHFPTFLIPCSLHWAEHLICKNVHPWLSVLFASTSQPSLYLVPYTSSRASSLLPDPGIEPGSPVSLALQADSLSLSHQGNPSFSLIQTRNNWHRRQMCCTVGYRQKIAGYWINNLLAGLKIRG